MAHGFLTPQAVTGEGLGIPYKKLLKGIQKLFQRDLRVVNANIKEVRDLLEGKEQAKLPPSKQKMLGGTTTKLLTGSSSSAIVPRKAGIVNTQAKTDIVGRNATNIDRKEQRYLGTTDPDVAGGPRTRKGGTFTDFGSTAQAKPLNNTNFFSKAVNEGIDANTGEYLSKEARIAAFQKGKVARNPDQSAPPISPDSGADIVAAVNRNTEAIMRMVDATKAQTSNDSNLAQQQIQAQETLMSRSAARAEEKSLEQGSDLSSFLRASKFKQKEQGGTGGNGSGDGFDLIGTALDAYDMFGGRRKGRRGGGFRRRGASRPPRMQVPQRGGGIIPRTRPPAPKGGFRLPGMPKGMPKGIGPKGGALSLLFAGMEFGDRKAEGQTNLQAGVGTAASVAGGLAGAKGGAAAGAAIGALFGGVGAVPGALIGGLIGGIGGSMLAGGAADMATGASKPFATGGIITKPTQGLVGEAGKEGVFPLEGKRGRDTFLMMGEGILEAQRKGKQEYADLQSLGLKRYFQEKDGFKAFGDILGPIMKGIFGPIVGGLINKAGSFLGNTLNNIFGTGRQQNNLTPVTTGGLADFIGGLESGNDYTKMVGGKQDASVLNKTIDELMSEKGGQFAMGRYQIQMRTASEVLKNAGIDTSSFKFDQAGQDKIFELLLKRRGIDDFMSGKISQDQFAKNLSMEWAALPQDASGRGYYDGVGTNKSLTSYSSVMGQLSALKGSGSPFQAAAPGGGAQNLAAAAQSLRGMSTADGPDGGKNGCVYAVNKVFNKAGITPPWGSSLYVPDAEKSMIDAGWQQVPYDQMQPGDVFVMKDQKSPPQAHIGVATDSKMILSNSSGKASMSWSSTAQGYNSYYGGVGALYRMPGQQAVSTAQAGTPGAPPEKPDRSKFTGRSGAAAYKTAMAKYNTAMEAYSAPGPVPAAPAAPNTGTPIMATSAQVASASTAPAAAPTIINNYYGGGGDQGGAVPNGVSPGIGMQDSGTAVFQDLRIRSLA